MRRKGAAINIRKQIDYSELYRTLDKLVKLGLTDTELCYKIGQAICVRSEKGTAVVGAEYLREHYPNRTGYSPRNLRRIRDFCHAYKNEPGSAQLALQIGWTLNVIILEGCNSAVERAWCLENTLRRSWKKAILLDMIKGQAWPKNSLDEQRDSCYTEENNDAVSENENDEKDPLICRGNICHSPMAEFVMKDLVKKAGLASQFQIASAATSREEIGNPVYPPARRKLAEYGTSCSGHTARQLTNSNYGLNQLYCNWVQ